MARENDTYEVEEKNVDDILIAGIRFKGKYSDCGKYFSIVIRKVIRYIRGNPFNLYYDLEYKKDNADIESCFPIKQPKKEIEGVNIRTLPGGRCLSLIHKGPYQELGRSYEKIINFAKENGYNLTIPTREKYIKGPGMIFKGNPKKYITEIQMMVE